MPININLLNDDTIARGVVGPPLTADPFGSYFAGSDQAQKQKLQNLFAGGIPRDINGNPDYRAMAELLASTGGAQQLPAALGLLNQDYLQKLPPIGSTTSPPPPPPVVPNPAPVSLNGPGGATAALAKADEADVGGERLRPDQKGNTVASNEVGPAMISVDGGPQEPLALAPTAKAVPPGYPPQFSQTPDTGPATDRFRPVQTAQAQPQPQPQPQPRSQIPAVPAQQAGQYNEGLARQYDVERDNNLELARRAGLAGNKEVAEQYRQKAIEAAANAKMVREGLIGAQRKQAETQIEQEKGIFDEGRKSYKGADEVLFHLGNIDSAIKSLGPNWMGAGANARITLARQFNTALNFIPEAIKQEFDLKPFAPGKVADWESFNKETQKLGFAAAKELGSREAQQVIAAATASVPNAEQTYWGARLVSASMRQAAQRQKDYFKGMIEARRSGQSLIDYDVNFNQTHPVQSYVDKAIAVVPPQAAINALMADPSPAKKAAFEKKYGDGALVGVFGAESK